MPNHHIRAIHGGRGCRDESNDALEAPVQPPEAAAHANHFLIFLIVQNKKYP
jgi:hypothetical protein